MEKKVRTHPKNVVLTIFFNVRRQAIGGPAVNVYKSNMAGVVFLAVNPNCQNFGGRETAVGRWSTRPGDVIKLYPYTVESERFRGGAKKAPVS